MSSSLKLAENLKPFKTTRSSQLCIPRCKTSRLHKFFKPDYTLMHIFLNSAPFPQFASPHSHSLMAGIISHDL